MLANQRPALTDEVQSQISQHCSIPLTLVTKEGVTLNRCPSFMTTPETERYLYPNLTYFLEIANSGDAPYSYFRSIDDRNTNSSPPPCTWGSDKNVYYDERHQSNPKGIIPTYHELDVTTSVFGNKLYGTFTMKDTRVSETAPPISNIQFNWEGDTNSHKEKIPPDWRKTFSKDKERFFYWNVKTRKSQWEHPWPTMMDDLQKELHVFKDITDNYDRSIHSNMDLKGRDFYSFIGDNRDI